MENKEMLNEMLDALHQSAMAVADNKALSDEDKAQRIGSAVCAFSMGLRELGKEKNGD